MPYDVKLPDIGEGVAEGEIVRWLVKAGDSVKEDQPLVEVMTDKASVEIPSPRTGTIASLHAEEGQVVPVGSVIISIALAGETAGAAKASNAATASSSSPAGNESANKEAVERWNGEGGATSSGAATPHSPAAASAAGPVRVQATPAVRQLAKQLGVALENLSGSGPGGAITAQDVQRAANPGGAATATAPSSGTVSSTTRSAEPRGATTTQATAASSAPLGPEERVPLRGLRRKIAEHMRRSIDTAAHFTFVAECDMTALVQHRGSLKARADRAGIKLTYLAYIVKALIDSLRRFPMLNASLDDERGEIVLKRYYHIGIATHTEDGLTVPILRDADQLPLFSLAREIQRLSEAARAGKLKLEEIQGGTFTVTSSGAQGGVLATPILHHPQVAILGVHEIKPRPAVVDGKIVARDLGNLSLSLDHRVVDGAVGADFLYDLIHRLEHPGEWLNEGAIE